jgi:hypothetical protein
VSPKLKQLSGKEVLSITATPYLKKTTHDKLVSLVNSMLELHKKKDALLLML